MKLLKKHPKSLDTWTSGDESDIAEDELCCQLQRYLDMLDEDYIEKNKKSLPADFVRITPNFITSGVQQKEKKIHIRESFELCKTGNQR